LSQGLGLAWAQESPSGASPAQAETAPPDLAQLFTPPVNGAGVTADEAARRAVNNSHAIDAKRHAIEAARAGVTQAEAGFWPQLVLQARYTRLSPTPAGSGELGRAVVFTQTPAPDPRPIGPGEPLLATELEFPVLLDQYNLQAGFSIPLSDYVLRAAPAIGAAQSSRAAAEYEARATELSVARDARVAYYEWLRSLGRHLVTSQAIQLAQRRQLDAQSTFATGDASQADVLRAEASVKQALLSDERARRASVLTELRLRLIMHDTDRAERYRVGENMLAEPAELDRIPAADVAYREALANRPELHVLESSAEALDAQARVVASGSYPRLTAQGNVLYANPNQRYFPQQDLWQATWDVGLVLTWRPTDIPAARSGSDLSRALAGEVRAQRAALEQSLRVEVTDAIESLAVAKFALGTTEAGLRAAEESYRVRGNLFRDGRATLLELADAESELVRSRMEALDARVNARIALAALHYVLGRPIRPAR
jgi:outer membrane protein TolC